LSGIRKLFNNDLRNFPAVPAGVAAQGRTAVVPIRNRLFEMDTIQILEFLSSVRRRLIIPGGIDDFAHHEIRINGWEVQL
jgi:hypothetical protein